MTVRSKFFPRFYNIKTKAILWLLNYLKKYYGAEAISFIFAEEGLKPRYKAVLRGSTWYFLEGETDHEMDRGELFGSKLKDLPLARPLIEHM